MIGIEYKSIGTSEMMLKDIDEKQGRILGYFSKFGNIDSDKDMIMPGAFKRTLINNISRIKHLWQHNPMFPLAGVNNGRLIISEDAKGLAFDSTISKTSYGKDAIQLYVDGVVDEHSIGFNTVDKAEKNGYTEIREIKLWEGSTVTWAANDQAGTTSVKSMTKEDTIAKMDKVVKALRNGKYENEEIFDLLEIYFKQLQQNILDLSIQTTGPADDATLPADEKGLADTVNLFRKKINS
jgi:HK97 family phage prohead protease